MGQTDGPTHETQQFLKCGLRFPLEDCKEKPAPARKTQRNSHTPRPSKPYTPTDLAGELTGNIRNHLYAHMPPLSMRPLLRSVQLQLPPSLSPHMLLGQVGMRRTFFFKGFAQTHRTHSTDRYKPMWHYMAALGSLQLRKIR